jgi:eukaryotic-like serine/threonine-protein kinase
MDVPAEWPVCAQTIEANRAVLLLKFAWMQSSRGLLQPGHVVAEKYVISRLLGRGGMGAVYVVEHRVTGKKLALKCLLPEHLEHPEFVERFLREAQAAGRIEHRNVVDVFDVGREADLIYIVMELLDGKPLSDLLRAGQLSLEETLQILLRAMDGVAAAHAVGIVHRDLKPDNILVCVGQSGRLDDPRVLDFGISKLEDDVSKPLTKSGVMLGTPYYMAFEQINSQRDLDQRVDVYAMGVILYEAMAGRLPYVAESVGALAIRMMSGPPTPLAELRPELPTGLSDVVMRSVARDRNQRYPTMNALMAALRPYAPDSANILTPLGQGTPMGTIRSSSQPLAIDPTMPALRSPLPPPGGSALAPQQGSAAATSMPTPTSRLRLSDTEGRTPSVVTSSRSVLWVVGLAIFAVLVAGSVLLALNGDDEPPPVVQLAPPPVPEPAPAAATPAPSKPAPTPAPEPTVEPPAQQAEAAPAAEPAVAEPAAAPEPARGKAVRGRKRKGRDRAEEPSEPAVDEPYVPAGTGMEPAPAPVAPAPAAPAPVAPEPEAPAAEPPKLEAPPAEAPADPPAPAQP